MVIGRKGQAGGASFTITFKFTKVLGLRLVAEKPEGVGGEDDTGKSHRSGGPGGGEGPAEEREKKTGGGREGEEVVAKGPGQILPDGADGGPTQEKSAGHTGQIAFQHHYGGGLLRGIGAAAERNAEISRGQGRGIVGAVARHRHEALGGRTKLMDPVGFALRSHTRFDLGDAQFLGDRSSGIGAIAG